MRLILIAFALLSFLFIFTSEALPNRGLLHTIFYIAYLRICRGNLPREFAVAICRENLLWEFAAGICRVFFVYVSKYFFCVCEQILFIWKQTFFIWEQNFLICEIFFIKSVSFCYCHGSYGHRKIFPQLIKLKVKRWNFSNGKKRRSNWDFIFKGRFYFESEIFLWSRDLVMKSRFSFEIDT